MKPEQKLEVIAANSLLERVAALRAQNARLSQICATALPGQFELTYSFDLDGLLVSLRIMLPDTDARVPSVSSIFGCAFLYENEMHDLFNIKVEGINVDFRGHLYNTAVKFAFGDTKIPPPKAPPTAAAPPAAPAVRRD